MLDYWTREAIVTPSLQAADGSGTRRRYSAHDVALLRWAARLRETRLELAAVKEALAQARHLPLAVLGSDQLVFHVGSGTLLLRAEKPQRELVPA